MDIQGWKRGNTLHVGDTILPPPEGLPLNYGGENDTALYRRFPTGIDDNSWFSLLVLSYIPLPPLGSVMPYLYTAFVAHLFFRSLLVVTIAIFAWAFFSTAYAFLLRILDLPVGWPRSKPPMPRETRHRAKQVHVTISKDPNTGTRRLVRYRKVVNSSGTTTNYKKSRITETMAMRDKSIMKNDPYVYWVDFESIFVTTALWNPLLGIVGMFLSWFSVYALDLEPFFTRLVSNVPEVNVLLVMEFVIFAVITLKLGRNTLWLWTAIGTPVYILAVMAPINKAYTHGFDEFYPYLYWLLTTIYFAAWFFRDPFGIEEILEYCHLKPKTANRTSVPGELYNPYGVTLNKKDPRRNTFYFWSIDGTYFWNAFFAVTILVEALALYKVIDLAT